MTQTTKMLSVANSTVDDPVDQNATRGVAINVSLKNMTRYEREYYEQMNRRVNRRAAQVNSRSQGRKPHIKHGSMGNSPTLESKSGLMTGAHYQTE